MVLKKLCLGVCVTLSVSLHAQTLGGNAVYSFMKLPSSALLTAAGGINASYRTNEIGFSVNNPALLQPGLNKQLSASFSSMLAGIKSYSLSGGYQYEKIDATIAANIHFVDYGSIPQTDAAGNESGTFRPVDFVVQLSAAKAYMQKWTYGASMKFIHSSYQQYRSSGLAFDIGVLYHDSARNFSASLVAKNMGVQLTTYNGEREDLPFDLQAGITQRLARAPFGFSVTLQQLHQFDITYEDENFNTENNFASTGTLGKIFNHFVFAGHIYIGGHIEGTIGYNHLRRNDLNTGSGPNGLTGFSAGLRLKFQKLQVLFARTSYQKNVAYNQFGLNLQMDRLVGL